METEPVKPWVESVHFVIFPSAGSIDVHICGAQFSSGGEILESDCAGFNTLLYLSRTVWSQAIA